MSFTGKPENFLEAILENDGFFPDVNLGDFQRLYRVPVEYKRELVEHHLRLAIIDCNSALTARKAEWVGAGATRLDEVAGVTIGGQHELVIHYYRAVFCRAMGLLVQAFMTLNRRAEAENLAKESLDTNQDYFAQSKHAVRRLLGISQNITVDLI